MPSDAKPYVVPIFIPHGGCPHQCIFCNQKQITGNTALPSPAGVREAILSFLKHCRPDRGRTEISFYGGNFLGLPPDRIQRYLKEAALFVTENQVDGLRFSTRPDTVKPQSLRLLEGFPVTTVELGVQSLNDKVLAAALRGHTAQDTLAAVALLKEAGYKTGLQMMTGLPGEEEDDALQTAQRLIALKPDFVRIYPTLVLSGSLLAKQYDNGRYHPMPLESCVDLVAEIYALFINAGIPVVRMGLQSSESLDGGGTILAGPYHPAFGHLVLSRLFLNAARGLLDTIPDENRLSALYAHPTEISILQGSRKQNLRILEKEFRLSGLRVHADDALPKGRIRAADRIVTCISRS